MAGRKTFLVLTGVAICGAVVLAALGQGGDAPQSPLAWLQYPLLLALAWGVVTAAETGPDTVPVLPYVALSWALGMAVELTLTVDGTGIGGVHADTLASFVLAQGDYIPLAVAAWALQRWFGCGLQGMAWVVVGIGLTEGLVFTGSVSGAVTTGAVIGALVVACYLIAIYMVYLLLPFRLCGLGRAGRTGPVALLVATGFATAFAVRVFWGLVYSPVVTAMFGLPPG